jgi:glycosyltransferase involved in cell wall biosynthesis
MDTAPIRVLWTSNILLPAAARALGLPSTPFGGWISAMTDRLAALPEFRVGVAMRSEVSRFQHLRIGNVDYFALPRERRNRFDVRQDDCERVLREFQPHILHVEGGEMRYARRFLETWKGTKLLSMQGVINGFAPYELGRLPMLQMLSPREPRIAITAMALLLSRQLRFRPRLKHERASMACADHIVGRTIWDKAQAAALAPQAAYHSCGRILRSSFYRNRWMGADCERHSIFVGNGAVPRKGAHIALRAVALLRRDFPDISLYIAGEDPQSLPQKSLRRHIGYPSYLRHLIKNLDLEDCVEFTGLLQTEDMVDRMRRSHVCLMCSIIENSPNTLGEAMMLGVPTVSAFCGGAPSMATDERDVLFYRADDPAMLSLQVRRIFENDRLASCLSNNARDRARANHDPERNFQDLLRAYAAIRRRGNK